MTIQKRYFIGSALAMMCWFVMVTWGTPLIARFPATADYLSAILATGTTAFLLIYRAKTDAAQQKKLCGRLLCYLVAGVTVSVVANYLR